MRKSFDIIGDIAVIEAESGKDEKNLLKKVISTHPQLKAVLLKGGETSGKYRRRKYRIIFKDPVKVKASGMKTTETVHKEFGCRYKLDVRKVFFNPRESTMRERIASLAHPEERVLVMFSGVGPYAILIARKSGCSVTAVEVNPAAHEYALENVKMNRVEDRVEAVLGDVRKVHLKGRFDRVVMPLGTEAIKYLDVAFQYCREGGSVHVFGLSEKRARFSDFQKAVRKNARKNGKRIRIVSSRVVGAYSPAMDKVCLEMRVLPEKK